MSDESTVDRSQERPAGALALAAACCTAFVVRCVLAGRSEMINTDGPIYLAQANSLLHGDLQAALRGSFYAPGTAAGIALFARLGLPLETAGYVFMAFCGALAVLPLHAIARRAFGRNASVAAVWLYAFLPMAARLGAQIYSTTPFLLFAVTSVALAVSLIERPSWLAALGCGLAGAVAYATRVDGLLLLPFGAAAALLARASLGRRLALAGAVVLPTVLAVVAYASCAGTEPGVWFTKKFSQDNWSRFCALTLPPASLLRLIWEDLAEALFVPFVPFAAAGLLLPRDAKGRRGRVLLAVLCLVWLACLLKLCATTGQSSKRYTTPIATLLLPWVAVGLLALGRGVARLLRGGDRARAWASIAVVALACVGCVPKLLKVHEGNRIVERLAGEFLRRLPEPRGPILCGSTCVPYYAEVTSVPAWWAKLSRAQVFHSMRIEGVKYVVLDRGIQDLAPAFADELTAPDATLVGEVKAPGGSAVIRIYRVERPQTASRGNGPRR